MLQAVTVESKYLMYNKCQGMALGQGCGQRPRLYECRNEKVMELLVSMLP